MEWFKKIKICMTSFLKDPLKILVHAFQNVKHIKLINSFFQFKLVFRSLHDEKMSFFLFQPIFLSITLPTLLFQCPNGNLS
jgi:hypothetical protein